MSVPFNQLDIFELQPLLTNFSCKLSTITDYDPYKQMLCLVSEENDIVLRYTSEGVQEVLKLVSWFRRNNRVIHDICFDPSGVWLLVLCFDNTLHIVPALAVVDKAAVESTSNASAYVCSLYSASQVTSYIIPFVGPHECPNSKKCPNQQVKEKHSPSRASWQANGRIKGNQPVDAEINTDTKSTLQLGNQIAELRIADAEDEDDSLLVLHPPPENGSMQQFSHDLPTEMLESPNQSCLPDDQTGNSQLPATSTSFLASNTCPYPLSVVWWRTLEGVNRAVVGYSDGSICFVGLSPNCPFVASTSVETGSVVKLLICRDNTFDSVMLLITSSLKQQFKLLLEQKAIKYMYPGEISPNNTQTKDNDWQIVLPLKNNASDCVNEKDQADDDSLNVSNSGSTSIQSLPSTVVQTPVDEPAVAEPPIEFATVENGCDVQPPPPPYSVAIARKSEEKETALTDDAPNSLRCQPQLGYVGDLDDSIGKAGILPAARARLASLKSLGSKKLNAIRMRLSDTRQKIDEYIPENSFGSFAIVDTPSLTPELLANSTGSFYTIQNLLSTYLLSALHSQSSTFTVHSIDIHLKPLFLYKIPPECVDILISSNILYSIQYVDQHSHSGKEGQNKGGTNQNTEKENLDMDAEKQESLGGSQGAAAVTLTQSEEPKQAMSGSSPEDTTSGTSEASSSAGQSSATSSSASSLINAVGVISSAMASLRNGEEEKFNAASLLTLFRFENETVLNLYQMASFRPAKAPTQEVSNDDKAGSRSHSNIRSPMDYVKFYGSASVQKELTLKQAEVMQNEFPKINYDPCYVVTNKNVYFIQLKKEPFSIFLESALAGEWTQCRDFCNTFDLTYEACIEFAGDYLLRRNKVTQALLTYNTARIKPIRTALKLAMFGQTNALMHLCAMALKVTHILNSSYFCHPIIRSLLPDITYRHSEDVRPILPLTPQTYAAEGVVVNEGLPCADYRYGVDEPMSQLQMSPSSQFHLANLLLITLAEKAVNDKNYMPLWNFLVTNGKYHTNMTSIVLCQSGLFSAALLLAKVRGVCIDVFLALNSVVGQEFGWYSELNVCLYNLSESLFCETITYLPRVSLEYFSFIQDKLGLIRPCVLKRLEYQLNPFSATMRPVVSHTSNTAPPLNDNSTYLLEFCKNLIETYLAVLIHLESQQSNCDRILNALSTFRLSYEDNQFAIDTSRYKSISAGCAHCACVVDGVAYFWGSNGVPCTYSVNKLSDSLEPPFAVKSLDLLSQLNLHVHAVKCGRQHTLILTNNGLYTMGNNSLGQLGIGRGVQTALQPMLVKALDGKNIAMMEAGQYHNAVVADGSLYTWGWGVYGQLGHGDTENVEEPKVVSCFKFKKVLQVALGHAHTLVLCEGPAGSNTTELYAFGSNHFGQLGLGPSKTETEGARGPALGKEDLNQCGQVKYLAPQRLHLGDARVRLIHTKFFTNLAVDESGDMFTWGASPQALRLANQIKRRANAKQKIEEHQRREVSRRFEGTLKQTFERQADTSIAEDKPVFVENESKDDVNEEAPDRLAVDGSMSGLKDVCDAVPSAVGDTSMQIIEEDLENGVPLVKPCGFMDNSGPTSEVGRSTATTEVPLSSSNQQIPEADPCEHMSPHLVDTSEVAGRILQVSSGLFHFALISSTSTLYTWGKNLEHQLGTEDKERRAVSKPSPIDNVDRPMYVDCGADFTLVMTSDFVVKAFGGNSNGQCGRDLGACIDKMKQRVVCLPTTKRLMRFESQCVEVPVEINLPRPRIRLESEPVRYMKAIPRYKGYFLQEADIDFEFCCDMASSLGNPVSAQESEDAMSSLENISQTDGSSLQASGIGSIPADRLEANQLTANSSFECSPDEQSYTRLPQFESPKLLEAQGTQSQAEKNSSPTGTNDTSEQQQQLCQYIHYCLYVFHGLYSPEKVKDVSKGRLEYRVRTLMLNFQFVEAFALCLQNVTNSSSALKIFEYFSKDTGFVPLRRSDLRFLIYNLMMFFMERSYDLSICETYFLADLDYYLLELAYVLYFNNNNTELEQNLNEKFKRILAQGGDTSHQQDTNQQCLQAEPHPLQSAHALQDTDLIFEALTVRFKTIVCQRLIKFCNS